MSRTRIRLVPVALALGLALACVAPAAQAQGKAPAASASGKEGPKTPEEKQARVKARIKQVRRRILKQEVGLDDKKAEEVEKVFDKYEPERQKLNKQLREQRIALRDLLKENSDDQAAYKKALEAFRATQKKLKAVTDREVEEISKLLTPKQQAKLMAALQRLRKRLAKRAAAAAKD